MKKYYSRNEVKQILEIVLKENHNDQSNYPWRDDNELKKHIYKKNLYRTCWHLAIERGKDDKTVKAFDELAQSHQDTSEYFLHARHHEQNSHPDDPERKKAVNLADLYGATTDKVNKRYIKNIRPHDKKVLENDAKKLIDQDEKRRKNPSPRSIRGINRMRRMRTY